MTHQLMKTATYGAMHFTVAVAVAYALTGSWPVALGIGMIEPAVQTVAYLIHERAWERHSRQRKPRCGDPAAAAA